MPRTRNRCTSGLHGISASCPGSRGLARCDRETCVPCKRRSDCFRLQCYNTQGFVAAHQALCVYSVHICNVTGFVAYSAPQIKRRRLNRCNLRRRFRSLMCRDDGSASCYTAASFHATRVSTAERGKEGVVEGTALAPQHLGLPPGLPPVLPPGLPPRRHQDELPGVPPS